ncbi:MAG: hypothetical protein ACI9Y1_002982 [Lentisphaeria bacterium]|jgi:uncharacterized protein YutE (UPF0331/DUF86 family)
MNVKIIEAKLESLRRCIVRIEEKTPNSVADLEQNLDAQDVIVLNLSRAIQTAVDIASHIVSENDFPAPVTMKQVFDSLQKQGIITEQLATKMKSAVGFRNIAVHQYDNLNLEIVYAICTKRLNDFKCYAIEITKILDNTK